LKKRKRRRRIRTKIKLLPKEVITMLSSIKYAKNKKLKRNRKRKRMEQKTRKVVMPIQQRKRKREVSRAFVSLFYRFLLYRQKEGNCTCCRTWSS